MKKKIFSCAALVFIFVFCVSVAACGGRGGAPRELIRIHIRADSNGADAQAVKLRVRDAVVALLTPLLRDCQSRDAAYAVLARSIGAVKAAADETLLSCGFTYGCEAELTEEYFPARLYGDITVQSGYYDALIIRIGGGGGDNWWCVVYPPLCFLGETGGIRYESKIKELWDKFIGG